MNKKWHYDIILDDLLFNKIYSFYKFNLNINIIINKMIKKLISIFLLMVPLYNCQVTNNLNCFTLADIQTKGYTYLNDNVYDVTGYNHPGGLSKLNQCKGQSLTTFFNNYKVHLNNNRVNNDLSNLFVGKLSASCIPPVTPPPTVLPPTVLPPTVIPTTLLPPTVLPPTVLPTTVPQPPTTQLITTNKLSTTYKPTPITSMITKPAISNTSNIIPKIKLQIFGIIMVIFLMN